MRRRPADRAASIGSQRSYRETSCDGRSRASAGASGDAVGGFGIADGTVGGIFVGAAHGELVAIGFTEDYGARGFETLDRGGVIGRDIVFENFGAASGAHAASADDVFDGDGDAGERWEVLAFC